MIADATGELGGPNGALAVEGQRLATTTSEPGAKKHFDAIDTDFFQQGDDSANLPGELYLLDDVDGGPRGKRPLLSRPSLLVLSVVSSGLALVACVALWRSNAPLAAPAIVAASRGRPAPAETTTIQTGATPVPAAQPEPSAPVPLASASSRPERVAEAAAELAGPVGKEAEETAPSDSLAGSGSAATVESEEGTPSSEEAPTGRGEETDPTVDRRTHDSDVVTRCKQSIRKRRNKQILSLCPAAFAEDGSGASVAVALAKAEFDRGRYAQASAWSKKAIAINPDSAEAYVFAGGAEQNQGHRKAAKEAYLQYLRLAPSGRYAAELRSILGSL